MVAECESLVRCGETLESSRIRNLRGTLHYFSFEWQFTSKIYNFWDACWLVQWPLSYCIATLQWLANYAALQITRSKPPTFHNPSGPTLSVDSNGSTAGPKIARWSGVMKSARVVRGGRALYKEYGVSIAIRGRTWTCKTGLGSRKVILLLKHVLRLNFNTKQENSYKKWTYMIWRRWWRRRREASFEFVFVFEVCLLVDRLRFDVWLARDFSDVGLWDSIKPYIVHCCDIASQSSGVVMICSRWSCTVLDVEMKTLDAQSRILCPKARRHRGQQPYSTTHPYFPCKTHWTLLWPPQDK